MKRINFAMLSLLTFATFTMVAILLNPWFSIFSNAYSDLGNPKNGNYSWIFNIGLIISSFFWGLYGYRLIKTAKDKLALFGATLVFYSSVLFALIGVFHEGTKFHFFTSYFFFVISILGMFVYSLNKTKVSIVLFAISLLGPLIPFPSVALLETFEILVLFSFVLLNKIKEKESKN